MHIVLFILKVIGITLLIILGIILLLVVLLLTAPFRYTVDAEYYGDINGVARIRWLIFVLDLKGVYGENRFLYYLKSFWFTISTNDENDKHYKSGVEEEKPEKKKLFAKKDQAPKARKPQDHHGTSPEGSDQGAHNGTVTEDDSVIQEEITTVKPHESVNSSEMHEEKESYDDFEQYMKEQDQKELDGTHQSKNAEESEMFEGKKGFFTGIREKLEAALEWITTIPMKLHYKIGEILSKILDFFANINDNVENLNQKKDEIMVKVRKIQKLLKLDATKHAIKSVFQYLKQILKHIAPRKYHGKVHFGMDDPAATGQVLGVFGALMPLYRDHILVRPDFENKVMEGELHIKGRIRIGFFAIIAVKALLNRDLMKTVKRVKTIVEG